MRGIPGPSLPLFGLALSKSSTDQKFSTGAQDGWFAFVRQPIRQRPRSGDRNHVPSSKGPQASILRKKIARAFIDQILSLCLIARPATSLQQPVPPLRPRRFHSAIVLYDRTWVLMRFE